MPHREKSDHWDLLASDLGASPPPADDYEEVPSRGSDKEAAVSPPEASGGPRSGESAVSSTGADDSDQVTTEPAPIEPPEPTDWSELAANLGVEIPEEVSQSVEPAPHKPVVEKADSGSFGRPDSDEPQRPAAGAPVAFSLSDVDEAPAWLADEAGEATSHRAAPKPAAAQEAEVSVSPAAESAGAEFSAAGAESEAKPAHRRRRRRRRSRPAVADEAIETPEELSKAAFGEGLFDLTDAEPPAVETSVEEPPAGRSVSSEEATSARPKRRRRRGSGRKKSAAKKESEAADAEAASGPSESGDVSAAEVARQPAEKPPGDEGQPGRRTRAASDEPTQEGKTSHRGIPTWAEAIDLIISTNMEARAKRPSGGTGRSRGGRKRGGRGKSSEKAS